MLWQKAKKFAFYRFNIIMLKTKTVKQEIVSLYYWTYGFRFSWKDHFCILFLWTCDFPECKRPDYVFGQNARGKQDNKKQNKNYWIAVVFLSAEIKHMGSSTCTTCCSSAYGMTQYTTDLDLILLGFTVNEILKHPAYMAPLNWVLDYLSTLWSHPYWLLQLLNSCWSGRSLGQFILMDVT